MFLITKTSFFRRAKFLNYLLDFSKSVDAAYLVTGDQNLLALKGYHSTKIISFRAFVKVLQEN